MCGRIALFSPPARVARFMEAMLGERSLEEWEPSWNVPPTEEVRAVTVDAGRRRVLDPYRWGLVPWWARDPRAGNHPFNARAESVASRPTFRDAFGSRRCLVPVDGFYEWRRPDRQPFYFSRPGQELAALAGLWERWGRGVDTLWTCTVVTTGAGPDMAGVHDRMPLVLERDHWDSWLDPESDPEELHPLLRPPVAGTLVRWPVDRAVGSVRNNGARLILEEPTLLAEP